MGSVLLNRISEEVFSDLDKWESFLELIDKKSELEIFWYQKFNKLALDNELKIPGWIRNSNGSHLYWKLENSNLNDRSLSIWFENAKNGEFEISLWASKENYNIEKLNNQLKDDIKFNSIKEIFNLKGEIDSSYNNEYIFKLKPTFYFENTIANNSNIYWYLGNKFQEIYLQLHDVVQKIASEQNTKLLEELHINCLK